MDSDLDLGHLSKVSVQPYTYVGAPLLHSLTRHETCPVTEWVKEACSLQSKERVKRVLLVTPPAAPTYLHAGGGGRSIDSGVKADILLIHYCFCQQQLSW